LVDVLLGVLHQDGELGLFSVNQTGISQVAKIMNHKRGSVQPGREPVADFIMTQPTQSSVAFYVFEAFGSISIYQVFMN
jgi:hypothetical protein